ncbi:MAG: hypothetical protein A3G87_09355 [Omnitrophica bacterium RIFCSPLOWO2_12_FULL_50_11]|nr:MAG: hypothetical protein A3G87_09355 [Omnitrophica bacterium RIFCSPLOWO2_12_FULL_50_11]
MIGALIVDDETPARNELKRFLEKEADFKIVGEAQDGEEALSAIRRLRPQVVFLDIHIPKQSGLQVATALSELKTPPLVVFITAYDQYAIQAFELSAVDYILKPYDGTRFKSACQKVRQVVGDEVQVRDQLSNLRDYLERSKPLQILGHRRNSRDRIFIHPNDVLYFRVKLTEVTAHLSNGEELILNATLKLLFDMLDPSHFQQAHRSYIVNLGQVEKVRPLFGGNCELVLKNSIHSTVPLSRRYARKLKKFLKW